MAGRTRRKLVIDDKVEVRSVEDGFLGSWHTGTVIGYEDLFCVVQYDHLLDDQGSGNLTEQVKMSPAVVGVVGSEVGMSSNYRGLIRPFPPSDVQQLWCPHYGQCVDMFYEDAWWEGVIFDHEDGCGQRRIFFPDMGDEMEAKIDMLRSSMDWNEVTGEWKLRGNWLFLELIEELEQEWPLPVSLKQIWYEVRMKNGFEKLGEWTSSGRDIWRELVKRVLFDNIKITLKHHFTELNSSWNTLGLGHPFLQFSEQAFDDVLKNEGLCHSSLAILPFEATPQLDSEGVPSSNLNNESHCQVEEHNDRAPTPILASEQALSLSVPGLPILSQNPDEDSILGSKSCNQAPDRNFNLVHVKHPLSIKKSRNQWWPVVPRLISGAEYWPKAIDECKEMFKLKKRPSSTVIWNARKHILYLNWKVEFMEDRTMRRFRYFSPEGELFYSFRLLCLKFDLVYQDLQPGSEMILNYGRNVPLSSLEETLSPSLPRKSPCSGELSKLCSPDESSVIKPEYCPQAVRDYHSFCQEHECFVRGPEQKLKSLKAKKHLSAIGWSFYSHVKGEKRETRYISPSGKLFYSLASVCKWCVEHRVLTSSELSRTVGRMGNVNVIGDSDDHMSISNFHHPLLAVGSQKSLSLENQNSEKLPNESFDVSTSEGLVQSNEGEVCKSRILRRRGKHIKLRHIEGSVTPSRRSKPRALMQITDDMDACSSTPLRRSSKRIRDMVASSSQQTPRTVLSWLIDNNVVLPRAKVRYCGRNRGMPMKEGRIAREGIKCSCCGEIYSLSKFEAHAGSTNHRPSANIFLDDGRSLLECQLQLNQQKSRHLRSESHERKGTRRSKTNDCICSICHYGGELLLCDQCPSSFHIHCVGLKGVPDGDWFCPSCCCQICGQGRLDRKNGQVADSPVLICGQCEHRYHIECLRNNRITDIDYHPDGYWFCQDTCKQIFYRLRKILGKPIPVGTENLTWTLVKYIQSDSHDHGTSDDESLMENYSKLNVALSVMHECFEPVREPGTRRDLVEDVIFSRWSELNRLNFEGFYTVLLEKNDELISAATVRIFGKKVAEVPLVATRFQYRRLGMCRVLMNVLEKNLKELGVERLVLPAVPSVLNTWTTSFGFSMMNESDRLNFLENIFLDFPGTVTCQKILASNPSSTSSPSTETQVTSSGQVDQNLNIELDGNSTVSEVLQVGQVGETEILEYGSTSIAMGTTGADNENGNCSYELAVAVNADQSTLPTCLPYPTALSLDCPIGVADGKQAEDTSGGLLKCYKRRRISAC